MQPSSPIEMIPPIRVPEQSSTTGLMVTRPLVVEVSPTPESFSSSSEKVDYREIRLNGIMCILHPVAASSHT